MADIQFDEEQDLARPLISGPIETQKQSALVELILRTGITTDAKIAEYILLGIALLFFLVSIVIMSLSGAPSRKTDSWSAEPEAYRAAREAGMRR
ncbi:MAG: hypothetical protein WAV50_00270 [Minisyncoccia bacterium]